MMKLFRSAAVVAVALLALAACAGGAAPPPAAGSRQVTTLPPAVEASFAAICRAYPVALRTVSAWLRGPGTQPVNASRRARVIAATDRADVTLNPACHGNVTEAALATVSAALNDLTGAVSITQGVTP